MLGENGQGITVEQRGQLQLPILILAGSQDSVESKCQYAEAWRDGFTGGQFDTYSCPGQAISLTPTLPANGGEGPTLQVIAGTAHPLRARRFAATEPTESDLVAPPQLSLLADGSIGKWV